MILQAYEQVLSRQCIPSIVSELIQRATLRSTELGVLMTQLLRDGPQMQDRALDQHIWSLDISVGRVERSTNETIDARVRSAILVAPMRARSACSVAAVGAARPSFVGRRSGTGGFRLTAVATAFALP
jgi:hypothetical protein